MNRNPDLKLAIRTRENEGVIIAYVSDMDEKDMLQIATLDLAIARKDKRVFEAWVKGMEGVMSAICEAALGQKPSSFFRFNLGDKQ